MKTREIARPGAGIGGTAKGAVPSPKSPACWRRSTARTNARPGAGHGPTPEPMTRRRLDHKRWAKRARPEHGYAGMGRGGLRGREPVEAEWDVMDMSIERLPLDVHLSHERAQVDGTEHLCQVLAMDGKILAAGWVCPEPWAGPPAGLPGAAGHAPRRGHRERDRPPASKSDPTNA